MKPFQRHTYKTWSPYRNSSCMKEKKKRTWHDNVFVNIVAIGEVLF